ncbi:RICIN domain-containing protein [Streptomyces sp. NPDC005908]|uniref:RICIN domain-containing protein n=1 Tax=Streptomyces sp. NPDC005908 TaxID=3157084 RepID=UPI0033D10D3B
MKSPRPAATRFTEPLLFFPALFNRRRNPSHSSGILLIFALAIAVVAGLLDLGTAQRAGAAVGDRNVVSWNMEGANSPTEDRWRTGVAFLAARADVVALQEAGPTNPPSAPGTQAHFITENDGLLIGRNATGQIPVLPPGVGRAVRHSIWEFGTRRNRQQRHVYFLATDRGANANNWDHSVNRVNLAIVSSVQADNVAIIPNPLARDTGNHPYSARAALGIRIGDTWYFDLHGLSGSGNDDAPLLASIVDFVAATPVTWNARHWIAVGDYNRDLQRAGLQIPAGTQIYRTGTFTHGVGGQGSGTPSELDYGVGTAGNVGLIGRVTSNGFPSRSDHLPVHFGALRAAAEPTDLYEDATVESMEAGGVLDAVHGETAEGTPINSNLRNGGTNQRWTVRQYDDGSLQFVGLGSGRCIDYLNDDDPEPGEPLQLWDCTSGQSQRWAPEDLGNSEYQLHNLVDEDLCMTVRGGQTDIHDPKQVELAWCLNKPGQRWIFTPSVAHTTPDSEPWDFSQHVSGPVALESLKAGGLMDVSHNQTGNGALIVQYHRTRQPNQGWYLDYIKNAATTRAASDDGNIVTFRGVQSNRCLDIHNPESAVSGREVVIFDCQPGRTSQQWKLEQLRGEEVVVHSVAHPELCLDVFHGPTDPDEGYLDVYNCSSPDDRYENQTWLFTPYDLSGDPVPDSDDDTWDWPDDNVLLAGPGGAGEDLTSGNRATPLPGMPDWSRVGYQGGQPLPGVNSSSMTDDTSCIITAAELDSAFGVKADDGADDTTGLQKAIDDVKARCSPQANYRRISRIELPAGTVNVSRQMYVDASFLVIRGEGSGSGGTKLVFRPDTNTRYDTLTNGRWDQDTMKAGTAPDEGSGGWIWPGRGLFRVQTREVATRYQDDWAAAPANRKDLFEGSVNQHWASGIKLSAAADDPGFSARRGQNVIHLDPKAVMTRFTPGAYVWVGAANSRKFYAEQGISGAQESLEDALHMRQQMFQVAWVDATAKTVTVDRPLEWDLPVDDTSDGSAQFGDKPFPSKITPLKIVEGVGFENFAFTQDMNGLPKLGGGTYQLTPAQAVHNYGNMAPEYAMHGIVFKWAANSWARGLTATMTGSHPIVTEDALNLQIEHNSFDGAWNKGKGGNGYLRGSRVWQSLYAYNLSRNLRHFTFQWSASDNVAFGNDLDSDLNLHGGWEHGNLFEQNTVETPYDHRSGSCTANCGGEGGEVDEGTWYPVWWAAGPKAIKWSGSSGPQNVFYNNTLTKQTTPDGAFVPYGPYGSRRGTAYEFGSDSADPRQFRHLGQSGQIIPDWTGRETADYTDEGVATREEGLPSLFLRR